MDMNIPWNAQELYTSNKHLGDFVYGPSTSPPVHFYANGHLRDYAHVSHSPPTMQYHTDTVYMPSSPTRQMSYYADYVNMPQYEFRPQHPQPSGYVIPGTCFLLLDLLHPCRQSARLTPFQKISSLLLAFAVPVLYLTIYLPFLCFFMHLCAAIILDHRGAADAERDTSIALSRLEGMEAELDTLKSEQVRHFFLALKYVQSSGSRSTSSKVRGNGSGIGCTGV